MPALMKTTPPLYIQKKPFEIYESGLNFQIIIFKLKFVEQLPGADLRQSQTRDKHPEKSLRLNMRKPGKLIKLYRNLRELDSFC